MTARQFFIWLAGAIHLAGGMLLFFSLFGNTTYKYFRHFRNIWGEDVKLSGYQRLSGFFVSLIMIVLRVLLTFKAFHRL